MILGQLYFCGPVIILYSHLTNGNYSKVEWQKRNGSSQVLIFLNACRIKSLPHRKFSVTTLIWVLSSFNLPASSSAPAVQLRIAGFTMCSQAPYSFPSLICFPIFYLFNTTPFCLEDFCHLIPDPDPHHLQEAFSRFRNPICRELTTSVSACWVLYTHLFYGACYLLVECVLCLTADLANELWGQI